MKVIFFTATYLVIAAACSNNRSELSSVEMQVTEAEVRKVLNAYYADIQSEGLNAEFRYLDSTESFFWVPPSTSMALSYDSVAQVIRINAGLYESVDNTWDTLLIRPVSRELAIYTGRLRSVATDTAGTATTTTLVETGVVTKRDGRWKLMCGQTSLVSE